MERLVVFSIDKAWDSRALMRFLKWYEALTAMGQAKPLRMCIGRYKGDMELSFITNEEDYLKHLKDSSFLLEQQSILLVDEANVATLIYKDREQRLGFWKVHTGGYLPQGDYTYDLGNCVYYTCMET